MGDFMITEQFAIYIGPSGFRITIPKDSYAAEEECGSEENFQMTALGELEEIKTMIDNIAREWEDKERERE